MVKKVVSNLKVLRSNSDTEFKKQFAEATKIGRDLHGEDFQLATPRLSGRQVHRSNPPLSTPEDYYRVCLYDEFLSHVISELEERFINNPSQSVVMGLLNLVPSECVQLDDDTGISEDLTKAVEMFKDDLPHSVMFTCEYNSWVREWKQCSVQVPDTLVGALHEGSSLSYPNLTVLLKIALTLPITLCESERSFSQLKLIRRSTMTESRLTALALMKINRGRCNQLVSQENMTEFKLSCNFILEGSSFHLCCKIMTS